MNKEGQRASIPDAWHRRPRPRRAPRGAAIATRFARCSSAITAERTRSRSACVRHPDDALDVVQDAFIKAHKYLDKFEGTSSFYTWLYRIVMNLAIDHLRKHRRVRPVELDDAGARGRRRRRAAPAAARRQSRPRAARQGDPRAHRRGAVRAVRQSPRRADHARARRPVVRGDGPGDGLLEGHDHVAAVSRAEEHAEAARRSGRAIRGGRRGVRADAYPTEPPAQAMRR